MMKNASGDLSIVFVGLTDGVACRYEKSGEKKAVGSRRSERPSHASPPLVDNTKRRRGREKREREESNRGEAECRFAVFSSALALALPKDCNQHDRNQFCHLSKPVGISRHTTEITGGATRTKREGNWTRKDNIPVLGSIPVYIIAYRGKILHPEICEWPLLPAHL